MPINDLANELVKQIPQPENGELDALYIAIATVNGINFLLTGIREALEDAREIRITVAPISPRRL